MWSNKKTLLKWYSATLLLAYKTFLHVLVLVCLHTNCQLLKLILFTDDDIFTCIGVNNICNLHRQSHDKEHSIVEKMF
jgi:hypothetical protein